MIIAEITEKNVKDYMETVPAELLNEVKRENCKGIAGVDDYTWSLNAAVFWELKNTEDERVPTEAELLWFFAENAEDGEKVLKSFERSIVNDEIKRVTFELEELGEEEQKALKAVGFSFGFAEGRDIYVTIKELAALKLPKKDIPEYVKPLSKITSRQYKAGIMTSVFRGRYGLLDDLPFLPMTRFDPDVSCCYITDDKVNGFLLVHKSEAGYYRVELLCAMQPDANLHLLNMMRYSILVSSKTKNAEDLVLLRKHNAPSEQLIKKLFPQKKGREVMKGEKEFS